MYVIFTFNKKVNYWDGILVLFTVRTCDVKNRWSSRSDHKT